jgi:hypothetical protein
MKKLLAALSIAALLSPMLAFADYNTVSLNTNVALNVGGVEVDISGSPAVIESIKVNASSFSFTLESGSSIQVSAPNLNVLNTDTTTDISNNTCTASLSEIAYVGTAERTVTITPSSSICSGSSNSSSSGGGGGSSQPYIPSASTPTMAISTTTPTASTTAPVASTTLSSASGLTNVQITSILALLSSFGADANTLANVQAALTGSGVNTNSVSAFTFTRNLTVGMLNSDVLALQKYLNAHGFTIATTGAGSPGNETMEFGALTKAALIRFQKANHIVPASGYFGQKTRAVINASE